MACTIVCCTPASGSFDAGRSSLRGLLWMAGVALEVRALSGCDRLLGCWRGRDLHHRFADEGDEVRYLGGPVHDVGQHDHGFTPIDALKTFVAQSCWQGRFIAVGPEICVLIQEMFTDSVCDRVLHL